jgi:ribosomal protein S18 acetylase RimI-like enzyme
LPESTDILDNPAWVAITGRQSRLGRVVGAAARYRPEICPLAALRTPDDPGDGVKDLAELMEPGEIVGLPGVADVPANPFFRVRDRLAVRQMVCERQVASLPEGNATPYALRADDAEDMLRLAEATRPGPFTLRTIEMGTYLGVREGDELVAMAGERMTLPGYCEVSAVCTAEHHRGRGLARLLVCRLCELIRDRGERPFLHVVVGSPSDATATRLYEELGFSERAELPLLILERLAPL